MARSTGFPGSDAQDDFLRTRRQRTLARLAAVMGVGSGDVELMLPFDEVTDALGKVSELDLGVQTIALNSIVGTVDRGKEFDRRFRPTSSRVRPRFERIADAQRRGASMPPIDVYRIADIHFVRDGHHRVAVARAQGRDAIDARVVEVTTRVPADRSIRRADLPLKSHERLFRERIPLPQDARERLRLSDPAEFGRMAEGIEAWGFRLLQHEHLLMDRSAVAARWFNDEYLPVVTMLADAKLIGSRETETDAYLRLSCDRYRLMRTQDWSNEAVERVRRGR